MKKIILIIMLVLTLTFFVACSPQTITQESENQVLTKSVETQDTFNKEPTPSEVTCPSGRIHEDFAGCGLYKDSDTSGYCDYSE